MLYPRANDPLSRHGAGRIRRIPLLATPLWWSLVWCISLWASASPAAGQGATAPVVAFPRSASSSTDSFYTLDLRNGSMTHFDRLRRDPLRARTDRVSQNLFQEIGRPLDQPAAPNEILLTPIYDAGGNARAALFAETSTGYVAFFEQIGRGSSFGRIITTLGRPFGPLASPDGQFALLMRRDSNGRTVGAYLYHHSTGRTLYLGGLAKLEMDPPVRDLPALPTLPGRVSAAELQNSDETTTGYLVADSSDGSLRFFDLDPDSATRITVRASSLDLFEVFDAEGRNPTPQRFVAVPLLSSSSRTEHVFFVDVANGQMALLENVAGDARPILRKLALSLYNALATDVSQRRRTITPVARHDSDGETTGVWLIDSLTRAMVFVENPGIPGSASIRRVAIAN